MLAYAATHSYTVWKHQRVRPQASFYLNHILRISQVQGQLLLHFAGELCLLFSSILLLAGYAETHLIHLCCTNL
jgi:hypothetical protein